MTPDIESLDAYRLENHLSFKELSHAFGRVGLPISASTLYHCVRAKDGEHLTDRTLYRIRKFLGFVQAREEKPRRRAKRHWT